MRISYIILLFSLIIGFIVDYVYRSIFPYWFVPVMTAMTAMFLVLGYRGWTEHW